MNSVHFKKHAAVALSICTASCANSLRTPPAMESLASTPTAPAGALLEQADSAWSRRAEAAQAAAAEELYLQAARAQPENPAGYAGAIRARSFRLGREKDGSVKSKLAESAVAVGQACEAQARAAPACDYWLAAALGLQARERAATAHDALPHMVELLRRAEKADPSLDSAGPARLLAILLLRAPGWPIGPGDPESALSEARAAARLQPGYPPNLLALGEALGKNGHASESQAAYSEALRLAVAATGSDPDAAGWADDARKALHY
jgi:hypothetical protein